MSTLVTLITLDGVINPDFEFNDPSVVLGEVIAFARLWTNTTNASQLTQDGCRSRQQTLAVEPD